MTAAVLRACAFALVLVSTTDAQERRASAVSRAERVPPAIALANVAPNSGGAFLVEAAGGAIGSLVGIGIVALASNCDVEDLRCLILSVGAGGIAGVVGATIGTSVAARQTGSRRSVPGAAVGAILGTGVGMGVHYLLNAGTSRNFDTPWVVVPIFVASQGVFAALGSRF